jgi:hypothetical protein
MTANHNKFYLVQGTYLGRADNPQALNTQTITFCPHGRGGDS